MADIDSSREEVESMSNTAKKAGNIANNALDKAISNNKAVNNLTNNLSDKLSKNADKKKSKLNDMKNKIGKNKGAAAGGGVAGTAANIAKNGMKAVGSAAGTMAGGSSDDNGKQSGEIANKMQEAGKKTVQVGVDAARAAAGDPVAIARLITLAIKIALILVFSIIAIFFFLIICFIFLMGNILSAALTNITEAYQSFVEEINPTAIESFTMEDQYEILAVAFGTSVMDAYKELEKNVMEEINNYDINPAYNEWSDILAYNKSIGKIEYDSVVARESETKIKSDVGMPQDIDGNMVDVYIGGYTGSITDPQFETNSKKLDRYDLGLYKENSTTFATGEEPYFDRDRVIDTIRSEAAYAAVSDMAYLVSGYSVSMMEDPILDIGESVRTFELGITVISYKIDITERIFQQTMSDIISTYPNEGIISGTTELLKTIFNGESTYFKYDPNLITQISEKNSRWVYEYKEGTVVEVKSYKYTYHIDYEKWNPHHDCGTNEDGTEYHHGGWESASKTVEVTIPLQDCIDGVTESGYDEPDPWDDPYASQAKSGLHNATISSIDKGDVQSSTWVNRSGYYLTEKFYDSWTLDIPMEAFDVDRMMKAIFETNAYWGNLESYYTDKETTYTYKPGETDGYNPVKIDAASGQDEVLNYYGMYIGEWKYAYYDHTIDYPNGLSIDYKEGDMYDNGIDKQPYFNFDEIYIYPCNCVPNFGVPATCEQCGQKGVVLSHEIGESKGHGWFGERAVSAMTNPMINDNAVTRGFAFILTGDSATKSLQETNRKIKERLMVVSTTEDKLVLDDYTGDQVGGGVTGPQINNAGEVVLEHTDKNGNVTEYYPITVQDRILEIKNSTLNVLENSEYIQNLLAKTGLTYGERLNGENDGSVDVSPMADYIRNLVSDGNYTSISKRNDGSIMIGIGNWSGDDAIKIVSSAKNANPDKFAKLLEDNGLTEDDFNMYWQNIYKGNLPSGVTQNALKNVLEGILGESASLQNEMYNKKVNEITNYLQNQCQVTDPATVALLGATIMKMGIDDPTQIGHKGELASFNQDVIIGGISAGAENSLETTYNNLIKWANSGNSYSSPELIATIQEIYPLILADKEAEALPWVTSGIVPEDLQEMITYIDEFVSYAKEHPSSTSYSQGRAKDPYPRLMDAACWEAIERLMNTGTGVVSTDCSGLIHTIYWKLGYNVPTYSGGWVNNSLYAGRTDWSNIQAGDVVVWRNGNSGHVELYVGPGAEESIGFGSAPPKHRTSWNWHDGYYGASNRKFYRVVK